MRFVAALDTYFFGVPYAQGADVDMTLWTKRMILQHLDLGMIAPSQISAGQIADSLKFQGEGVSTVVDINGKTIVTIEMTPQNLDWLLDVDTTTEPPDDGAALVWDAGQELWVPGAPGSGTGGGGGGTLDSLTDVDTSTDPPVEGNTLLFDALTGQWIPGSVVPASINDLEDVDTFTTPPFDGYALVWDTASGHWVPGTASSTPGPPGPVAWGIPAPWSSSTSYVTGPPASVVTYLGSAYVAIASGANHQPNTSPTFWRLIVAKGDQGIPGDPGPASTIPGPPGPANTLSIGTVTTGPAGGTAAATITGTAPTQSLSLTIPTGATGTTGPGGPAMPSAMSWVGPLQVDAADTVALFNDWGDCHITKVRLTVAGASAGADIVVDVKLNGTTMFTTAPKPKVVAGALTGTQVPDGAPVLWTQGSYITCRITQVGSSTPGRTLTMSLALAA